MRRKHSKIRVKHISSIRKIEKFLTQWQIVKDKYIMLNVNIDNATLIHKECGQEFTCSIRNLNKRMLTNNFCKNKACEEKLKKQTCLDKYGFDHANKHEDVKNKISLSQKTEECKNKRSATHNKNNSWTTSKPEEKYFELLKETFTDVRRQYKDNRYPYCCDFYIGDLDIFIELNLHWSHGKEPFDQNNSEHIKKLELWNEKAKQSKAYREAIKVWTKRDIDKRIIAETNNITFIEIYKFPKEIFQGR